MLLRPIDPDGDAEPLYEVSHPPVGGPAIWTYLFDGPYENVPAFAATLREAAGLEDPLRYTIVRSPGDRPQGMASYMRITPEHGVIEIGNIWFGTPLQRTAAATEAIYLLARHAFDDLGYRRLEWKCNALNAPSRRSAERFGFRFEGVFERAYDGQGAQPGHGLVRDHRCTVADGAGRRSRSGWRRPTSMPTAGSGARSTTSSAAEGRCVHPGDLAE